MFDFVCIFTTGGVVLWYKTYCEVKFDILNVFIKDILIQEKSAKDQFNYQDYVLKWKISNELKLVFAIMYKEILQLAFVDEFLAMVSHEFTNKVYPTILKEGQIYLTLPTEFDKSFDLIWRKWEEKTKQLQGPKQMRTFENTKKGKKVNEKTKDQKKDN